MSVTLSALTLATMGYMVHAEVEDIKLQAEVAEFETQKECLALNIYHEARNEAILGQRAVGLVTLNRVTDSRYPNTVCDVVYQAQLDSHGNPIRNRCQFSWWCDGKKDDPQDLESWQIANEVAVYIMNGYGAIEDFTEGSVMYHAAYVNPYWKSSYEKTVRIDTHIFYK